MPVMGASDARERPGCAARATALSGLPAFEAEQMSSTGRLTASAFRFPLGVSWPLLVAAGAFLLVLARPARMLIDGDVYWHLAAGRWIIEHLAIPARDPFSYTLRDAPWTAHEWLAEIAFAGAYALGGWTGIVIVAAAAFAAALALLNRFLLRHLEPIYALLFTAMSASLLALHLVARPHTLIAPLLVTWGIGLVRAREGNVAPPWWLAWVMILWANTHGSFVLGLVLVAAFAAEACLASTPGVARRQAARRWGSFLLAATVASMLTPSGPAGLLFAAELDRMTFALSIIGEWRSSNFQHLQPLEICLLIAGGAILLRGLRLPPARIILLLGLLHLSLKHARHADLLGLLAPLIVAQSFAAQWFVGRNATLQAATLDRHFAALVPPASPAAIGLVTALLAAGSWFAVRADMMRPAANMTPEAAVHMVKESQIRGPVLNAYELGGYLIHAGIPPFIDGRADLYGDAFLKAYWEAVNLKDSEVLPQLLERYQIGWTLLYPGMPAVSLLDRLPGWRRAYADKTAVVHVRERALR